MSLNTQVHAPRAKKHPTKGNRQLSVVLTGRRQLGVEADEFNTERSGFSPDQLRKLVRDVDTRYLQSRELDGKKLTYIEGWYAIAQANAIFGHAGWDREMVHFERVIERTRSDSIVVCGYMARVRIRVRAGSTEIIREGTGWGSASASTATIANERALKAAETDATKRALSTFGASFGLRLYDKDHVPARPRPVFTLFTPDGSPLDDNLSAEAYSTGLRQLIEACKDVYQVDQLSRHNRACLADLRVQVPSLRNAQGVHFADLLLRLMQKRRERLRAAGVNYTGKNVDGITQTGDPGTSKPIETDSNDEAKADQNGAAEVRGSSREDVGPASTHGGGVESHGYASQLTEPRNPRGKVERRHLGPGDAFLRFTGQSARRRRPYPFAARLEATRPNHVSAASPPTSSASHTESDRPVAAVHKEDAPATTPAPTGALALNDETKTALPMALETTPTPAQPPAAPEVAARSKIAFGLKIDKSKLLLGLERRIRDKAHLRRVAELPCVVCNRQPSHAHHLRFAQRRGLSQKVSDEYVVPLCALHHGDLHRSSSEQDWWARQRIEPVEFAKELWSKYHV